MNRDEAKEYVRTHSKDYFKVDNSGKGFVCPLCESGTGINGTGINTRDEIHFTCWAGCFTNSDIIDIIGMECGITDQKEKFDTAFEKFGLKINNNGKYKVEKDFSLKAKIKNKGNSVLKEDEKINYVDFYNKAHENLHKTDYLSRRGIKNETLYERFNLGFVEKWKHSKAPMFISGTPRLIVPTDKYSYLARDVRKDTPKEEIIYVKQKEGNICSFFNIEVLDTYKKPVFIVEGEIDALSIIEVGGEAVALGSVAYINKFLKLLEKKRVKNKFVIIPDNDKNGVGQENAKKLKERLKRQKYNCTILELPKTKNAENCKDVNDLLLADRQALEKFILDTINVHEEEIEIEKEIYSQTTNVAAQLQNFINGISGSVNTPSVATGFIKLDNVLDGGLYEGVYTIGAISSLGKTTLVTQIGDQIAKTGKDVLIFSLEMSMFELIAKSISRNTFDIVLRSGGNIKNAKTTRGVTTWKRYRDYSDEEKSLIENAIKEYEEYAKNIYISEGIGNIGVDNIRNNIEKHISITGKKPIVIIDYIQILAPYNDKSTDKQNIDKAVLELKRISRDFKIPIIGISSLNRVNYNSPVSMESFKESGAVEYSSDVLIGLQLEGVNEKKNFDVNEAKRKDPRNIELVILKNRNGSTGIKIPYTYYPMFNYFEEKI